MNRVVLVTPAPEFASRVNDAVIRASGHLQHFQTAYLPQNPADILRQLTGEPPAVFILGPGLDAAECMRMSSQLQAFLPGVSTILVDHATSDMALAAMRSGVRDILSPDVTSLQIGEALTHATRSFLRQGGLPLVTPSTEGGRVIAVMSPKGGVGKTTVATNLAVGLGKIAPMGTVIVDLDLQFGDVASGLLLDPEYTITDAVFGAASQDTMVLKTFLSLHPSNAYALCAPRNPVEMDRITGEHVTRLINQLHREFQYVVIDTAPGLGEHVLAALEEATDAVWICGMDVPSIRGLRTGFQILGELNLMPDARHVVLNMADHKSGLSLEDVEATIGAPVDIVLPRSRTLPFATNKGVPVLQEGTRDVASKGLGQLVERFLPNWEARPHKRLHRRAIFQ